MSSIKREGTICRMRCPKCNEEMDGAENLCRRCAGETSEVQVLRPDERDDFKGLTIQQGPDASNQTGYQETDADNFEYRSEGPGHRVYVRQVSFGSQPFGFLTKLALAAMILFFIFVALPVALVMMAVFSIIWWLVRR